eukprot:CAMPEP_0119291548 /NCGR_PEP_ID=MMETSP1329-20130426/42638_1 /TAXON_ID=114041 /ORGANISM="Genus nov. species nov., Strain RCC1024" /LENGTH=228 /DNA_ID=CAMNT_0007292377 /DNA_START=315 /DNA_END=998 /DNA_ORIENTATION=+
MSLGWNTQSSLMPSKAKKIEAPKGSMAGLKEQVFKASMDAAGQAAAPGGYGRSAYARGTAKQRRGAGDPLDDAGRKRPGKRRKRTEEEKAQDDRDEARAAESQRKLAAKAQLYEDLQRGEVRAPSEVLVDFGDQGPPPEAPVDEFGRELREADEEHGGGTRWAWGRGDAGPIRSEGSVKELLRERAGAGPRRDEPVLSSAARVKSHWDKTATRDEKSHLGAIHEEAER